MDITEARDIANNYIDSCLLYGEREPTEKEQEAAKIVMLDVMKTAIAKELKERFGK